MSSVFERPSYTRALGVALMLAAAAACGGDGTPPPEPEPEVTTIRVSVGTFSTDIPHPSPCSGTNTPVPITVSQANQVTFRFLGANGQDEPIIAAERANLVLRLSNTPTGWTFTPTGGSGATFTANLTPTATGSFIPRLDLYSPEHDHNEVACVIRFTVS